MAELWEQSFVDMMGEEDVFTMYVWLRITANMGSDIGWHSIVCGH